jgi:hypothetical protein
MADDEKLLARYYTMADLRNVLRLSERAIEGLVASGRLPKPVKWNQRGRRLWRRDGIEAALEQMEQGTHAS